ncbi:MAG: adenylate/guanylate cyclase domain-containing protein [Nitriliruptoraceae bacterium]
MGVVAQNAGRDRGLAAYVPRGQVEWLGTAEDQRWRCRDATLVFVDVSGFTALSERLAQAGRIGAEELTDTIGSCFDVLLEVAYRAGGSLLKFGGDALLLFFAGEDHTDRACRAAVGMRQQLRALGKLRTSAGPVSLEMSIGVHSGDIHLFLVGTSHRELVVTGPGATETVEMEAAADAGQIVISPSTRALLDPSLVGPSSGPGFLLLGAPAGADPGMAPEGHPADGDLLQRALPVALRHHLTSTGRDAEHRRVTVAFLRFRGTDTLLADEGEAAAAAALDEMVTGVQSAADTHGVTFLGTDIDAGGGKVILVAGAPSSGGNDEERMLLALRGIVDQPSRLALQVGVHAGHVFAGDIGPAYRRAYTVMGDAVNLAARVMGRSLPRAVLATEPVLAASRTVFAADAVAPFRVKGKTELVHALRVGAVRGTRQDETRSAELPFTGRVTELAEVDRTLQELAPGSGRLIEVLGEPGIGKSRLLQAIRSRSDDRKVVELVCELHRATVPYSNARKLLREQLGAPPDASETEAADHLLSVLEDHLPHLVEWAPLLALPYGTHLEATAATRDLDEQFLRPRLQELVLELLTWRWSEPVLVTIEDAQWLDEASADLLRAVAGHLDARPWVVCTSRRTEDAGWAEVAARTALHLEPLDAADLESLATAASASSPLPADQLEQLVERSGGNPLFLQELVSAVRETGDVDALPRSMESLVTARIDRLQAPQRDLLREASVLGYSFPRPLAVEVLAGGDVLGLAEAGDFLLQDGDLVRFRHSTIRDVAYAGLSYRRRRRLHAKAGDTIAASGSARAELLSFHYHLAGRWADAWQASVTAGTDAAAVYANADAAMFLRRALEVAPRVEGLAAARTAEVGDALGDVLQRLGSLAEAGQAYAQASALLQPDPVPWSRVRLKAARVKAQLERTSPALADLTRTLRRLEGLEGDEAQAQRSQVLVWYGHLRMEQGRHRDAIDYSHRAIEAAQPVHELDVLAHAYRLLDWAHTAAGEPELAVHSARALAIYEELDDLPNQAAVHNNLGGLAYWAGDWAEAMDHYQRANALDEQVGDVVNAAMGRNNVAEILADQGHWVAAEELFTEALAVVRAADLVGAVAYVEANLGRVIARSGRFEEAEALLARARSAGAQMGAASLVVEADTRLAELQVLAGRPDRAIEVASETLQRAAGADGVLEQQPVLLRVLGYAHLQRGELSAAERSLTGSLDAARARDADYEVALAELGLAELARARSGRPDAALVASSRATLDDLGVARLPEVPLVPVARA